MQKIKIPKQYLEICQNMANEACIGGHSNIRDKENRQSSLFEDNYIGQVGNLAGCILAFGEEKGFIKYKESREHANKNKFKGDNGSDVLGWRIDFKCSKVRGNCPLNNYSLLVRPKERHKNCVYLLFLMKDQDVYYCGWKEESELPNTVEQEGVFKGAYRVLVRNLNKGLPPKQTILKCKITDGIK